MRSHLQRHSSYLQFLAKGPLWVQMLYDHSLQKHICLFSGKTLTTESNLKLIINSDVNRKKVMSILFQIDNNFPWYIYSSTDHRNDVKIFKNQVGPRVISEGFPWTFWCHFYNFSECRPWKIVVYLIFIITLRGCLHGSGVPQVGEVTRFGGVTRLSINSLILIFDNVYMIGRVTRRMLPLLSGVPHLHVNRPLVF